MEIKEIGHGGGINDETSQCWELALADPMAERERGEQSPMQFVQNTGWLGWGDGVGGVEPWGWGWGSGAVRFRFSAGNANCKFPHSCDQH